MCAKRKLEKSNCFTCVWVASSNHANFDWIEKKIEEMANGWLNGIIKISTKLRGKLMLEVIDSPAGNWLEWFSYGKIEIRGAP